MNRTVIEETLRRHVTSGAYLAYLALLAIIGLGVSVFDRPASVWPSMITLLAMITGCGVIGPEFSSGTLQLILVKPVSRAVYLLSRVTGVMLVVWLAALVPAVCEMAGRALWSDGGIEARVIGTAWLNGAADTILIVALLALLGSVTRAYFNIAIYAVAMIGISMTGGVLGFIRKTPSGVGRFLSEYPGIQRALDVIDHNLFPEAPPALDGAWMLMVLSNATIALLVACLVFRRREVPYGAD